MFRYAYVYIFLYNYIYVLCFVYIYMFKTCMNALISGKTVDKVTQMERNRQTGFSTLIKK